VLKYFLRSADRKAGVRHGQRDGHGRSPNEMKVSILHRTGHPGLRSLERGDQTVWRRVLCGFVLFTVTGCVHWTPALAYRDSDQKPKTKKSDSGGKKGGGPKASAAPQNAPVNGRSYDDIIAQSGPARRRAWAPRPIIGASDRLLVAVV